jgi:capsule polysaccharide export protein KpsE/RkpR
LELKEIKSNILFFEELYKTTLARSESNRIESIQQQKFLVVLSNPFKPDTPWQAWRHRSFFTVVSCLIIFIALLKFTFGISASHND